MLWGVAANAATDERACWPSPDEQRTLGVHVVRSIVYSFDDLAARLDELAEGVRVIALLNGETEDAGSDLAGWPQVCAAFAERFGQDGRILAGEGLNEWDTENVGLTPETAAWAVAEFVQAAAQAGTVWPVLFGSAASPDWVAQLRAAWGLLPGWARRQVGGIAAHPYSQRIEGYPQYWGAGEMREAIQTVRSIARGKRIWVTEYGIPANVGEEVQAIYTARARELLEEMRVYAACVFAWHSAVGAATEDFGLRDWNGIARPAWGAAVAAAVGEGDAARQ